MLWIKRGQDTDAKNVVCSDSSDVVMDVPGACIHAANVLVHAAVLKVTTDCRRSFRKLERWDLRELSILICLAGLAETWRLKHLGGASTRDVQSIGLSF